MNLSSDLISQFVKITKDDKSTSKETTVYGTTVEFEGRTFVRIDGSDRLTPISTTTDVKPDERVTVMIKDHTATVTGNISSPAARTDDVQEIGNKITEVEILVADKVDTEQLVAEIGRIDTLVSDNVTIKETLTAAEAEIDKIIAENVEIAGKLTAAEAEIDQLSTTKLDADVADITFATIDKLEAAEAEIYRLDVTYGEFVELTAKDFEAINADIDNLRADKLSADEADIRYAQIAELNATNATIDSLQADYGEFKTATAATLIATDATINDLQAKKLSATDADLKYANIDFSNIGEAAVEKLFSESGIIRNLIMSDGHVTGELVGVTFKGDLIEGNTVKADKLVVKGSDGLYYKLNFEAGTFTEGEVVPTDSLHGSVITAKSVTAEKVSVDDLVAFDATIGGFKITDKSIYSGTKESVDNTTRGIYLDKEGQLGVGDSARFLKFYKDQNGSYKLEISADSIKFSSGKSVDAVMDEKISGIQIGARNLIRNSIDLMFSDYFFEDPLTNIMSGRLGVGVLGVMTLGKE